MSTRRFSTRYATHTAGIVTTARKRYSNGMGRSPIIQRLMRELAGHNLTAAAGFLAVLAEFENE
jgi:hypothetical protein